MASHEKLLNKLLEHLDNDEQVTHSVFGAYETKILGSDSVRNGIFAATNKRLLFYAKTVMGYELEAFPYSNISSIEMGKNVMGHYISFFTSGNKVKMKWISKGDVSAFVTFVKRQMEQKNSKGSDVDDATEQLKKLADLKNQGILTEDEFAAKKKQILGL